MGQFTGADYEIAWPVGLFIDETRAVAKRHDSDDAIELVLVEALAGPAAADEWRSDSLSLEELLEAAERGELHPARERPPLWSTRKGAGARIKDDQTVRRQMSTLITTLVEDGYLEKVAPSGCVDKRSPGPHLDELLEDKLGFHVWPIEQQLTELTEDRFFDLVEVVHDLVARPRIRNMHDFAGCGWHYSEFVIEPARRLDRWRVNQILDRSAIRLRLAEDGEDQGRLVEEVDDARKELVERARSTPSLGRREAIDHAIALFRQRDGGRSSKRSAIIALAGLLEERRDLLKRNLVRKDEGALFQIANEFAIRHNTASQRDDYDTVFLDWIFWWYLATVELTDRLVARDAELGLALSIRGQSDQHAVPGRRAWATDPHPGS